MSNYIKSNIAPWTIYPLVMSSAILLFFIFRNPGGNSIAATYISIVFPSLSILLFELYLPYKKEWKPAATDWKNDSIFLVAIQMLLPKLLVWLSIHYVIDFFSRQNLILENVWPQHLPLGFQVFIVVLISDLLRYWLHRFCHTFHFLWRLHAVHHSVQKLYWLNTSRFHPLEKSLQFGLDVLPFMLLGVSEEVIALHYVLYAVNGFFQHCNIDLRYGWLNYIVSSSDHHRWHHSRNPEESNNNYGNNIILWDLLFGSFYLPANKQVTELGLINKSYPLDFARQLKTPLFSKYDKEDMPELSLGQYVLNILFRVRMLFVGLAVKDLLKSTQTCSDIQAKLLKQIISANKDTLFGKAHSFASINNYADYKKSLAIADYEDLRPYIEKQSADQRDKAIVNGDIILFNKTSGTTAKSKYIPVTEDTLKALKRTQGLLSYIQYREQPDYFIGKLAGIVSPAVEGITEHNIPYGAASGHFYKSMPAIIRVKYALPYEVFEISDYQSKYYCILLLLLQHKDITYFGSANPTTYLKLIEILNSRKADLLNDLKNRSLKSVKLPEGINTKAIEQSLRPSKKRLTELEQLLTSPDKLSFKELWPYIKLLTT